MAKPAQGQTADRVALARATLLKDMPAAALDALVAACIWDDYAPGAVVCTHESPARDVSFVASGSVRVTIYSQNGREVAFRDLGPGANFGEISAIDGKGRSASVVAVSHARLAHLPRERFWELLRDQPAVTAAVLQYLTALVRSLTDRVVDQSTRHVRERIQAELVSLARQSGVKSGRATIAPVPRHADIASRISTNREAVTRELSRLTRAGLIERGRDGLVVTSVARLEALIAQRPES